jgi:hypothetical protein
MKKSDSAGKIRTCLVPSDMTNFDRDDLPPDLADLGRRMRDERPVAEDAALARMMQRTQRQAQPSRRRAPRRTLAVSLATTLAMLSVTGVAAASLFGMNFSHIGKALMSSSQKIGTASSHALKAPAAPAPSAPAPSSRAPRPAAIGSVGGALASLGGIRPTGGAATPGSAASVSANLIPGNQANAGIFQYGPGRLVCRILRALGLRFIARLLGC